MTLEEALVSALGAGRVRAAVPLATLTTFKVGGPADWVVEARNADDLRVALQVARDTGVPVTVLGGGSNVLVADTGIRGLVIRARGGRTELLGGGLVRADAGVGVTSLVRWTINRGLAGLEVWAGMPGTVGGAIYGNAHYGSRSIGELVRRVRVVTPEGLERDLTGDQMDFGYDRSRLQETGEVLLWAVFDLAPGVDAAALRAAARASLASRAERQPLGMASAGCIFRNPDPRCDPVPAGLPASAGALIDRAGLKGRAVGGARVSTRHGNFIVNEGGARASDIRALVRLCQHEVFERFGVRLREEIVYLGAFEPA